MKLSDYVIDFLARRGVSHVFGISGGAAVHLFDSAARHAAVDYVFTQHEQSAAIAADGYARVTGRLGVAITTSGPGATTLPIQVWSMVKRGVTPEINALSTLMLLASIALVTLSVVLQRRR